MSTVAVTPPESSAARVVRALGLCGHVTAGTSGTCATACILPIGHDVGAHEAISSEVTDSISSLADLLWGGGPHGLAAQRAQYAAPEGGYRDGWRVQIEGTDWYGYGPTKDDAARDCEASLTRRLREQEIAWRAGVGRVMSGSSVEESLPIGPRTVAATIWMHWAPATGVFHHWVGLSLDAAARQAGSDYEVVEFVTRAELERVRADAFETCARCCEMVAEHMSPRFCASEIRRLGRRATPQTGGTDR